MAGARRPGTWTLDEVGVAAIDEGTAPRTAMPAPGPTGAGAEGGDEAAAAGGAVPAATAAATAAAAVPGVVHADIEALQLSAVARAAAYELRRLHPQVRFTSGRRDVADQARAMAANVVANRRWIEQTYRRSTLRQQLQAWVDEHPEANTRAVIAAGLEAALRAADVTDLARFSRHLSGDAFDVQPVADDAEAIKATIRALPGLDRFLETEGGLERWHAQF